MAFPAGTTTFHIPESADAGSSQWGTDVRKLNSSASAGSTLTTITNHGTGGAVTRTHDPFTTTSYDLAQADYGWAVTPSDMNSVTGALRFIPAGNHTITVRMNNNTTAIAKANCRLDVFVYRVGVSPGRTRTLIDSWSSASFSTGALNAYVTVTATKSLAEIIVGNDETLQLSTELNATGTALTGETYTLAAGTQGGVSGTWEHPGLNILADADGTITETSSVSGITGKVLGANGSVTGDAAVSGQTSSVWSSDGTVTNDATVSGLMSSVFAVDGSISADVVVDGKPSIVLGTDFTVDTGSGGTTVHPVFVHNE